MHIQTDLNMHAHMHNRTCIHACMNTHTLVHSNGISTQVLRYTCFFQWSVTSSWHSRHVCQLATYCRKHNDNAFRITYMIMTYRASHEGPCPYGELNSLDNCVCALVQNRQYPVYSGRTHTWQYFIEIKTIYLYDTKCVLWVKWCVRW